MLQYKYHQISTVLLVATLVSVHFCHVQNIRKDVETTEVHHLPIDPGRNQ